MSLLRKLCAAVTLCLLLPSVALGAAPDRITTMYAHFGPDQVHLVVEVQSAATPLYQVYYQPQNNSVVIDMRNVEAPTVQAPQLGPDNLISSWELRRPNFLSAVWEVRLGYAIPTQHIQSRFLTNPSRIEVDIGRAYQEQLSLPVTGHIHWRRYEVRVRDDFYLLNEMEIAYREAGVTIGLAMGSDGGKPVERPTDIAARLRPLLLVNGGFFTASAGALGLVVDSGKIVRPQVATRPPRTALGLTGSANILMSRVEVKDNVLHSLEGQDWSKVVLALGAGPRLVKGGRVDLTVDEEALGHTGNDITHRAARTAVARLKNGHLLLATVTGYRDNHTEGWLLSDLASWLCSRGAEDAMCMDGGGSTAMVLQGQLISHAASNRIERKVADALTVNDSSAILLPARVSVTASRHAVAADGQSTAKVVAEVTTAAGQPVEDGTSVYFSTANGTITPSAVTHAGRAVAYWKPLRNPGVSQIAAYAGFCSGSDRVMVEAAPASHLAARVVPTPLEAGATPSPSPNPTRYVALEILATDANYNGVPNVEVRAAQETARTGVDGLAHVRLEVPADLRQVRVTAGSLAPVDVDVTPP